MNKKSKNTRELESKASKGDILSAFQLYQNYSDGQDNVDIDERIAEKYFTQCINYIEAENKKTDLVEPENSLKIKSLELFDFRCFKYCMLSFESDLTVIIGGNGQGKTSIAYAIAKTLSWVNANILKEDGIGQRISSKKDIKNDSKQFFSDVITSFSFGKGLQRISARLSRAKLGAAKKRDSEVKELKDLANLWRIINDKKLINLPLCAFYSVERSHLFSKSAKEPSKLRSDRFDAYHDALIGTGKFEHFVEWFISLHKKTLNDQSGQIEELEKQIHALQHSIDNGAALLTPYLQEAEKRLNDAKINKKSASEQGTLTDLNKKTLLLKRYVMLFRV